MKEGIGNRKRMKREIREKRIKDGGMGREEKRSIERKKKVEVRCGELGKKKN